MKIRGRLVQVTFYITIDQAEELKKIKTRTNIPVSVMFREGVGVAIDRYRDIELRPNRK